MPLQLACGGVELKLFTTITTLGTPRQRNGSGHALILRDFNSRKNT
jgi:hypothetical protein